MQGKDSDPHWLVSSQSVKPGAKGKPVEDGFNIEGVCHKLCLNNGMGKCPLAFDDVTKNESLNSLCHGPI
jgi:hypothetical protein